MPEGQYLFEGLNALGGSFADAIKKRQQYALDQQQKDEAQKAFEEALAANTNYVGNPQMPGQPTGVHQESRGLGDPATMKALSQLIGNPHGQNYLQLFQMMRQAQEPSYDVVGGQETGYSAWDKNHPNLPARQILPGVGKPVDDQNVTLVDPKDNKPHVYQINKDPFTKKEIGRTDLGLAQSIFTSAQKKGQYQAVKDAMGRVTSWVSPSTGDVVTPQDLGLGDLQAPLSSTTKSMVETAPKVKDLVQRMSSQIDAIAADPGADKLGAIGSRWQEFMTGKIGAANPTYNKLRVDAGLLSTLLMRMHVGARGSEKIMEKFDNLIGLGNQSPENLKAALGEIADYANTVEAEKSGISQSGKEAPPASPKATHRYNPATKKIEAIK